MEAGSALAVSREAGCQSVLPPPKVWPEGTVRFLQGTAESLRIPHGECRGDLLARLAYLCGRARIRCNPAEMAHTCSRLTHLGDPLGDALLPHLLQPGGVGR